MPDKKQPFCWKCNSAITTLTKDDNSFELTGCTERSDIKSLADAKKLCPLLPKGEKVIISIVAGTAQIMQKPDYLAVEIRDYTIDIEDWDNCKTDEDGDHYQEILFPATKIKFSANGPSCFTDEPINSIGWQPHEDNFPIAGLQTFEVYEDLEMGKGCHPEVKNWIEIFEGVIEKPVIIPTDKDNISLKNITILSHNISYFLEGQHIDLTEDDHTIKDGDNEYDHIYYMITKGYKEGELNKTNPYDEDDTIIGWWRIVK